MFYLIIFIYLLICRLGYYLEDSLDDLLVHGALEDSLDNLQVHGALEDSLDDLQVHGALVSLLTLGNIPGNRTVLSCCQELSSPHVGCLLIDQAHDAVQLLGVVPGGLRDRDVLRQL